MEFRFLTVIDEAPQQLIEVKLSDTRASRSLHYFHHKYGIPAVQIVKNLPTERMSGNLQVLKILDYLKKLQM
ncbi:hypothetical protein [Pelovirga terrestris]|uniref:Uncharacterized protein n=1 Tax=Pelovirga terrestris TaxID=2771352 RepID=A0A8J6UHP1_9BACT|nr:hypothetical protein [Pelovirga terrestris]MBD1399615.1 hypothetical protein [Pelovirga terrestris]